MFVLLESRVEITKAQRKLEATIGREFRTRAIRDIGYPGGTTHGATIQTDGQCWFRSGEVTGRAQPNPRELHWFGLFEERGHLEIAVEINTPFEGRNERIEGFFARNSDTGLVYLMHSGRIGGSTEGVGKRTFLAWCASRPVDVIVSTGDFREGLIVMPIEGKAATKSLARYIEIVARFKQDLRARRIKGPELQRRNAEFKAFYPEPCGRRTGVRSSEIDYVSRHGEVVDTLRSWRLAWRLPKGSRVVKRVLFDLGVATGRKLTEVYEVKTSAARSDVYAAIGQLMVHGPGEDCRRVMVLPGAEPLSADLAAGIRRVEISVLRYELDQEKATILQGGRGGLRG